MLVLTTWDDTTRIEFYVVIGHPTPKFAVPRASTHGKNSVPPFLVLTKWKNIHVAGADERSVPHRFLNGVNSVC